MIIMPLVLRVGYRIVRNDVPMPIFGGVDLTHAGDTYEVTRIDGDDIGLQQIGANGHRGYMMGINRVVMTTEYWLSD